MRSVTTPIQSGLRHSPFSLGLRLFLTLSALLSLPASASDRAYTRFFSAEALTTVSAFITGAPDPQQRFRTIVPSNPDDLTGQFFVIHAPDLPASPITATLEYIPTNGRDPLSHTFTLPPNPNPWLYLGLTGNDWPSPDVQPIAWALTLRDASGQTLHVFQSFLWR